MSEAHNLYADDPAYVRPAPHLRVVPDRAPVNGIQNLVKGPEGWYVVYNQSTERNVTGDAVKAQAAGYVLDVLRTGEAERILGLGGNVAEKYADMAAAELASDLPLPVVVKLEPKKKQLLRIRRQR